MALAATLVWEGRTTGNDNNGGAFKTGASGTDYSQQDAAQKSGSNLAIHASDNTKVQPSSVAAADVGNTVQITAGSGFTAGPYEIIAQDGTYWTLDRAAGTVGSTGGTYAMGGAMATPGKISGSMVGRNKAFIKDGTYDISSTTGNIAGGNVSLPAGTSAEFRTEMIGYSTVRERFNTDTRPIFRAAVTGASSRGIIHQTNSNTSVFNIEVNGNKGSYTGWRGISTAGGGNHGLYYRCYVHDCQLQGIYLDNPYQTVHYCETANNTSDGLATVHHGMSISFCYAHDNGGIGFQITQSNTTIAFCIAKANANGFYLTGNNCTALHIVAVNNTGRGIRVSGAALLINAISYGNSIYGLDTSGATLGSTIINYAAGNNSGGNYDGTYFTTSASDLTKMYLQGYIALSGDPFTNAGSGDLTLNNTAGAGAACRAAGWPTDLPGLTGNSYRDIGAYQHQDSGGSSNVVVITKRGGTVMKM